MSLESITLSVNLFTQDLKLRTPQKDDLDNLREWKNSQRQFFFYKEIISLEQQNEWYSKYLTRSCDYMFMVILDDEKIGCMGIRLVSEEWDVYNVILGNSVHGRKGFMGSALKTMLRFAYYKKPFPIRLKVLKHNPAIKWYQKNGFEIISEGDIYFLMQYNDQPLDVENFHGFIIYEDRSK